MEFKEFLLILKTRGRLFWGLWLGIIFIGLIVFFAIPVKNEAILSFDVARGGDKLKTEEYQYDQFYRLEADDRFSQVIVQWSGDPNFQRRVSEKLKGELPEEQIRESIDSLSSEKKAANFLQTSFFVENPKDATVVAKAIKEVLEEKIASLEDGQQDKEGWFRVIASGPTVELKKISFSLFMAILVVMGLMTSLFIVFAVHYFQEEEKQDDANRN